MIKRLTFFLIRFRFINQDYFKGFHPIYPISRLYVILLTSFRVRKAYLTNEYRKVISEKKEKEAGKIAVTSREIKKGNIDEENVSQSIRETEEGRSRKIASEKFHVGEWKVREALSWLPCQN